MEHVRAFQRAPMDRLRRSAVGRGIEVALGQGSAELPELLAILEEHQYRGYLTVARRDSSDPIAKAVVSTG